MKGKLKPILIVFFGSTIALACVIWSLGGGWRLPEKVKIPENIPLLKHQEATPKIGLTFDPKEKTIYQGESFTIDVLAETEEELLSIDLFFSYNPQILELERIKPGRFFSSPMEFSKEINNEEGEVFYATGSPSPATGKGILVSLIFKAKSGGEQGVLSIEEKTLASAGPEKMKVELPGPGKYSILKSEK